MAEAAALPTNHRPGRRATVACRACVRGYTAGLFFSEPLRMSHPLSTDVLIVGGGVAGLWLNARLRQQGFATLLLESASLGGGQSVKSQGIIHGGAKYALHGALTGASEAIADMPRRWRDALAGRGELDLRGVRLLSDAHYLWSPGTLAGNLTSFFASKAVRSRVDQVKGDDLPPALRHPDFKGKVYRLSELVLDVPSLIARLAELSGDSLLACEQIAPLHEQGELVGLKVDGREIRAQRIVLSAGGGTAELLTLLGLSQPAMQTRPLHMVMVKGPSLLPLYAHCMGGGSKPRITVTSHPTADGQWVWYLGGDLAEADGVAREPAAQIAMARQELNQLLPWIDLGQAHWDTLRVDRAEPAQSNKARPDNAFLAEQGRLLVSWPTKLALAPDLADRVLASLTAQGIQPQPHPVPPALPRPAIAAPAWEHLP
jgi:glycerol-3-phosphate dehydrogenase